ncbi:MAG: hypothetical protein ACK5UR_08820 [Armatimonadota bacterium]|jgi:hypothetical protein|nr:hypothetical protein [Fimbriimonadaceae bacterium]MCZ8139323.1 hypothetical protein [Fimbriimonadaceae bacterium]
MTNRDHRTLAALIHYAGIPFPWMGAIVGYFVAMATGNQYARYHAARAFLGEVAALMVTATVIIISLIMSIPSAQLVLQGQWDQIDWVAMLVKSVVVWLMLALFGLWNTVSSIIQGTRALRQEEWGKNRGLDRLALKLSGNTHRHPSLSGPVTRV